MTHQMTEEQRYRFDVFGYVVVPEVLDMAAVQVLRETLRQGTEQFDPVARNESPLHWHAQWRALLDLQASGKARSVGVSNFNESHLDEIAAAGLPMPDANQIELHPWSQKPGLLAHMAKHDIAPIAYSSLVPLSTWRTEPGQDSAKSDEMKADNTAFKDMAEKYGVSEAQLLLRWGVQNGYAVLPKSLNPERMSQNLDLFTFTIDDADMAQLATMDRGDGVAWATGDPSK